MAEIKYKLEEHVSDNSVILAIGHARAFTNYNIANRDKVKDKYDRECILVPLESLLDFQKSVLLACEYYDERGK